MQNTNNSQFRKEAISDLDTWKESISDEVSESSSLFSESKYTSECSRFDYPHSTEFDDKFLSEDEVGDQVRKRYYASLKADMPSLIKSLKSKLYHRNNRILKITMVTEKQSVAKALAVA